MNIILFAIPFFILAIFFEIFYGRFKGSQTYRVNDATGSLLTGILNQCSSLVQKLIPFTLYALLYQHLALFSLGDSIAIWIIAFVLYDFFYYWNHRFGHEINVLWAAHVVHHSSEDYNLSTALRQTGTGFLSFVFYLPMAAIGIEPHIMISVGALNLIYQFWVHTQHIGKLSFFELVLVTPSNHRAHHAQNPIYIDKNYGGVFIIWDRLFGTFQEELDDEPVVFGITGALQSWNPIQANLQVYQQLLFDSVHTRNIWHKFAVWFKRTGWRPPDVEAKYPLKKVDLKQFQKYDTNLSINEKVYAVSQLVLLVISLLLLLLKTPEYSLTTQAFAFCTVIYASFSLGYFLDISQHRIINEAIKHVCLCSMYIILGLGWLGVFLIGASLATTVFLFNLQSLRRNPIDQ